jgi:hypothetical protein
MTSCFSNSSLSGTGAATAFFFCEKARLLTINIVVMKMQVFFMIGFSLGNIKQALNLLIPAGFDIGRR